MENKEYLYLTLIAVVAIVAMVALSTNKQSSGQQMMPVLDDSGNVVGHAWSTGDFVHSSPVVRSSGRNQPMVLTFNQDVDPQAAGSGHSDWIEIDSISTGRKR